MIAENLRKSLLQAAIQGRLTEQKLEDGNAIDLLKAIREAMANLGSKGKTKKENPLADISTDEIPFDIPENWAFVRLGDVITLKSGQDMTPDKYNNIGSGIPYITGASNFSSRSIKIDRWTETPQSVAFQGDILITCKGTVGELAILNEEKAHIARQVMAIRGVGQIENAYIIVFLLWYVSELKLMAKSMIPGISREMVLNSIMPLPPLNEQKRIVTRLDELLSKIEELKIDERKLAILNRAFPKKMKDSILQFAIQGKLTKQLSEDGNAQDFLKELQKEKVRLIKEGKIKTKKTLPEITEEEIPFDIPENWSWTRLGDLVNYQMGKTPPRQESSYWGNDIPWISIADMIENGEVLYTKERISVNALGKIFKNRISPKGTLIMSFKLTLGRVSILGIDATHNEAIISIFPYIQNNILQQYLFKILPTITKWGNSKDAIKGQTLNSDSISNLVIPLPPIAEQERIVKYLDEIIPLCNYLE